jgi:5-methylcytosine-specific restriction endonuclease McrA
MSETPDLNHQKAAPRHCEKVDRRTQRKPSYAKQRESLWRRGLRRCYYCELQLTMARGFPHSMTLDHKMPLSRGGRNSPENYVAACRPCNNDKGDMTLDEYLLARRRRARDARKAAALAFVVA